MEPTAVGALLALVIGRNPGFWRYWLRRPSAFDESSVAGLARHALLPAAAAAVFSLACVRLGQRLGRRLFSRPPEWPLAFGLGLACVGTAFFLSAWLAGLSRPVLAAAAAALAGCALLPSDERAPPLQQPASRWAAACAAAMGFAGFHGLVTALAPVTDWDALAYHLAIPKLYLRRGGVVELPWLIHSHWPHMMETLYALPLGLGLEPAAALLHLACAAALAGAVFHAGREHAGIRAAWLAAAALCAQTVLLRVAGVPHADAALALLHFLSCVCLWRWKQAAAPRPAALAAAGFLAGAAAACKLFGLVPLAFWTAWLAARGRGGAAASRARSAAFFLAAAGIAVGPWLWRCAQGAGNPVWPFFSSWLGGRWGAAAIEAATAAQSRWPWPPPRELFWRHDPALLLAPLVLAWALARRRAPLPPALRFFLLPVLPYFLAVFRQNEAWRYMLACMPALCLALAYYADALLRRGGASAAAGALLLGVGALGLPSRTQNNELFAVAGLASESRPGADPRRVYLERSLDHAGPFAFFDARLAGRPARLLLFREIRGYYLESDYLWGDPFNQGLILYDALADSRALAARLQQLGVTHVLVNEALGMYRPETGYYSARALALMDGVTASAPPPLRAGGLALYELPQPSL